MTLCIGAAARDAEKKYVVCCFDRKIETDAAGSETGYKIRKLPHGWGALLAGDVPKAEELIGFYTDRLQSGLKAPPSHYAKELRAPAYKMKQELIEQYVQSLFGMSYQEFRQAGSQGQMPETLFAETLYEIGRIDIGCQLILFSVGTDGTKIFSVDADCSVSAQSSFCAVGTGARSATAWLHFRKQNLALTLEETLYHTYEAKKFAENAPGVGKETKLMYISSSDEFATLVRQSAYDAMWKRFGPRKTEGKNETLKKVVAGDNWFRTDWSEIRS
jgi:hypothetical protein